MKPVIIIAIVFGIGIVVIGLTMNGMEESRIQNFNAGLQQCDYILPYVNFMNPNSIEVSREWEVCYDKIISKYGTEDDQQQWVLDKQELELVRQNPHGTPDDIFSMPSTYSETMNALDELYRKHPSLAVEDYDPIREELRGLTYNQISQRYHECLNGDYTYGHRCDSILKDMLYSHCFSKKGTSSDDVEFDLCRNQKYNSIIK